MTWLRKYTYEQQMKEIENASFTPLVMSANGGLAHEADTFYRRLASLLACKWDHTYSSTMSWPRCHLSFLLLRSAIQFGRETQSCRGHAIRTPTIVDLGNVESKIKELKYDFFYIYLPDFSLLQSLVLTHVTRLFLSLF